MITFLSPLLRPLARFLVHQAIPFQDFAEAIKLEYVRAARRAGHQTDSAVSVATGLQRREVGRLKQAKQTEPKAPNHLSRLVATWLADPKYDGKPLSRAEFDSLAAATRKDVHAKSLLDALLAAKTVSVNDTGTKVTLLQKSYLPPTGSDDQIDYLARNTGDHLAAAVNNLATDDSSFERAVHYNHLPKEALEELQALYEAGQMVVLERLNARAAELQDPLNAENHRFRAGGYFYSEPQEEK